MSVFDSQDVNSLWRKKCWSFLLLFLGFFWVFFVCLFIFVLVFFLFIFEEVNTWKWEWGNQITQKIEREKGFFIAELSLEKIIYQSLPTRCRWSCWEDFIRKYMYLHKGENQKNYNTSRTSARKSSCEI